MDEFGVVAPIAAEPSDRIWFHAGGTRSYGIVEPNQRDVTLPTRVYRALKPLAERWTAGATTTRDKLDLLEQNLRSRFEYSLEFERESRGYPVLEFLFQDRKGHCEYFASAMALLARSISIPARVVGGYRVHEYNPLGDYYVVRERHAHTWIEAWTDEAWVTYDPTPPAELMSSMQTTTPTFAAIIDLAGTAWAAFLSWLDRRTWTEMLSLPALLILLPFGLRWWRKRRASGDRKQKRAVDTALPCYARLSVALENRGLIRDASETVEQLAERSIEILPHHIAARVSVILRRYAALRYGDIGDADELDSDVDSLCRELAS